MAKPDPALLDARRYPHSVAIATRYADLDSNKHINNIAIAALFEDARVRFVSAVSSGLVVDRAVMVASFTIDYLSQSHYPEPIALHSAVTRVGRTSLAMVQLATQQDRPVALGSTVMVLTDGARPVPLPADWVDALERMALKP